MGSSLNKPQHPLSDASGADQTMSSPTLASKPRLSGAPTPAHLDLGSECIWIPLQDGLDGALSGALVLSVVEAVEAVACVAVPPRCKAFTVPAVQQLREIRCMEKVQPLSRSHPLGRSQHPLVGSLRRRTHSLRHREFLQLHCFLDADPPAPPLPPPPDLGGHVGVGLRLLCVFVCAWESVSLSQKGLSEVCAGLMQAPCNPMRGQWWSKCATGSSMHVSFAHLDGDCPNKAPVLIIGWKEKAPVAGAEPLNPLAACWKRPDSPEKEPCWPEGVPKRGGCGLRTHTKRPGGRAYVGSTARVHDLRGIIPYP